MKSKDLQQNFEVSEMGKKDNFNAIIRNVKKLIDAYIDNRIKQFLERLPSIIQSSPQPPDTQHPRYLKANEVCKILSISKSTLHRMTEKGTINKYYLDERTVRYLKNEVLELPMYVEPLKDAA